MSFVLFESPFKAPDFDTLHIHLAFALWAEFDLLAEGLAPVASHLLYPFVLPETDGGRSAGIAAREQLAKSADRVIYFDELGWSPGMRAAWDSDLAAGRRVETRRLSERVRERFDLGGFPDGTLRPAVIRTTWPEKAAPPDPPPQKAV